MNDQNLTERHPICPTCGAGAVPGAAFCGDCGHSLSESLLMGGPPASSPVEPAMAETGEPSTLPSLPYKRANSATDFGTSSSWWSV